MPPRHRYPRTPDPEARPGWKLRIEDWLGLLDPIRIVVYRSYGTADALHLRGRVIERKGEERTEAGSPLWQNVLSMIHRLESDEIPGARLRARFQGKTWETTTDGEGYFRFDLDPVKPMPPGWHEVEIELVESVGEPERRVACEPVLIPSPRAAFGVVSDLDDTVIETHSTELLRQLAILFGKAAQERVPFPGVPAFYRALFRGPRGRGRNPIFYVSRSGWNLYDLFEEFMAAHEIPIGPLFLSDLRLIESKSALMGSDDHKYESIDLILRTYPELPFVLIGDSGMHDPELYERIVRKHPGRVRAVYIHDVSDPKRDGEVREIAGRMASRGVPMLLAENTTRAAEHAAEAGFISRRALGAVRREVKG